jgi:hypothetical protein
MTNSVGYKKPPKNGQFKKGQSGNPKGRPKKDTRIAALLRAELDGPITIRENGKEKIITKREALLKRLCQMALEGDPAAMKQTFTLVQSKAGEEAQIEPAIFTIVGLYDKEEL